MTTIQPKHIKTLFRDMEQYGLRGNSALWRKLPEALIASGESYTAESLLEWVDDYVNQLICGAEVRGGVAYLPELNQGGMSGGQLDLDYWFENMRPELVKRCQALGLS